MLLKKFLLLGLPVIALAATTTEDVEDEDELTTTTKSTSTGFKTSITTSASSSKVTADDEEEEEEEEEDMVTITTTSRGAKVTQVISASEAKNATDDEDSSSWKFKSWGELITDLPSCTRYCFEAPLAENVTNTNCAKMENWNCLCHFYNPKYYAKVFNDTIPVTTTTKATRTRTSTGSATTSTAEPTETAEAEMTDEEISQEDWFNCLDESCGIKEWGAVRDGFKKSIEEFHEYCMTEEAEYDEERNKQDFQDIKDAEEALARKKKEEEEKKNRNSGAGRLDMGLWTVAAAVGLAAAFAL